jgi:hypothetical protein
MATQMKISKKRLIISALVACLVFLLVWNVNRNSMLAFASGTADAYGDEISEVSVWQGGAMKGNITHANYTAGVQVKVDALTATQFNCSVLLNDTFAASTAEAQTNTRVYLNITYTNGTAIISTTEITDYYAVDLGTGFYLVKSYYLWDDAANFPVAGVTYYVWFNYEVYR